MLDDCLLVNPEVAQHLVYQQCFVCGVALTPCATLDFEIGTRVRRIDESIDINRKLSLFVGDVHAPALFGNRYNLVRLKVLTIKAFCVIGLGCVPCPTKLYGRMMLNACDWFGQR
jgi:hypothetical protein